jgi:hypothetical protein
MRYTYLSDQNHQVFGAAGVGGMLATLGLTQIFFVDRTKEDGDKESKPKCPTSKLWNCTVTVVADAQH